MSGGGKAGHVTAGLRDDDLGDAGADAGDAVEQPQLVTKGCHRLADAGGELGDGGGDLVDALQVQAA